MYHPQSHNRHTAMTVTKRRSFTLVELLVALALAALLLAATGQAALSVAQLQRVTENRLRRHEVESRLWESMADDLSRLTAPFPGEETNLRLPDAGSPTLELSALVAVDFDDLHVPLLPAKVRYRTETERDQTRLLREVVDVTALGRPVNKERIAQSLTEFRVEALVQGTWTKVYPIANRTRSAAQALRVSIRWKNGEEATQRTFRLQRDVKQPSESTVNRPRAEP